jgi:hypothetical protein
METMSRVHEFVPQNSAIFKLPEEKDPVICICFSNEFEAQRTNADLFEKWRHELFTLTLFTTQQADKALLNINLVSDNNQRLYKQLDFNFNKLHWWLQHTQGRDTKFKFCHTIKRFDKIEVIKPANHASRYFVLNVKKVIVQDLMELSF